MPQTPQQRAGAKIMRHNNQRGHADAIREREKRICEYLASHPAAQRSAIVDEFRKHRSRTGEALSALVKRGVVVRVDAPDRQGLYMLKEQRARVRWAMVVDDEPQTNTKGGNNG
jgi:hypothetical protein